MCDLENLTPLNQPLITIPGLSTKELHKKETTLKRILEKWRTKKADKEPLQETGPKLFFLINPRGRLSLPKLKSVKRGLSKSTEEAEGEGHLASLTKRTQGRARSSVSQSRFCQPGGEVFQATRRFSIEKNLGDLERKARGSVEGITWGIAR